MAEFVWKKQFNIGVEEIDTQHQALVKLVNEFIEKAKAVKTKAVLSGEDFITVSSLMSELKAYTETHFRAEELLMKSVKYPELKDHQRIHNSLREHVEEMEQKVNSMDKNALNKMIIILRDWYVEHIMEEDKRIGAFILSRLSSPDIPSVE